MYFYHGTGGNICCRQDSPCSTRARQMTNPRFAAFAPSKPQGGLTERHENHSHTARQSRDLFLIFGAADFVSSLGKRFNQRFLYCGNSRLLCQPPNGAAVD